MHTLTSNEAAEYLAVTEASLRSMRSTGVGPAYRRDGRAVRYSKTDLDAYIAGLNPAQRARRSNRIARQKERGILA